MTEHKQSTSLGVRVERAPREICDSMTVFCSYRKYTKQHFFFAYKRQERLTLTPPVFERLIFFWRNKVSLYTEHIFDRELCSGGDGDSVILWFGFSLSPIAAK